MNYLQTLCRKSILNKALQAKVLIKSLELAQLLLASPSNRSEIYREYPAPCIIWVRRLKSFIVTMVTALDNNFLLENILNYLVTFNRSIIILLVYV